MANVKIAGNTIILTSTMTMNQLQRIEKHRPEALTILDEKDAPIFRVGTGANSLTAHGASFNAATLDNRELAYITLIIPEGVTNGKQYFAETFGKPYLQLKQIESALAGVLEQVEREIGEIMDDVQFADAGAAATTETEEE